MVSCCSSGGRTAPEEKGLTQQRARLRLFQALRRWRPAWPGASFVRCRRHGSRLRRPSDTSGGTRYTGNGDAAKAGGECEAEEAWTPWPHAGIEEALSTGEVLAIELLDTNEPWRWRHLPPSGEMTDQLTYLSQLTVSIAPESSNPTEEENEADEDAKETLLAKGRWRPRLLVDLRPAWRPSPLLAAKCPRISRALSFATSACPCFLPWAWHVHAGVTLQTVVAAYDEAYDTDIGVLLNRVSEEQAMDTVEAIEEFGLAVKAEPIEAERSQEKETPLMYFRRIQRELGQASEHLRMAAQDLKPMQMQMADDDDFEKWIDTVRSLRSELRAAARELEEFKLTQVK